MTDEAAARSIEALVGLLRVGYVPRAALEIWHEHVGEKDRATFASMGRRLRLGAPLEEALEVAPFRRVVKRGLLACFTVHEDAGADLARVLSGLVTAVRARATAIQSARASAAGVILSARLVAALPLVGLLGFPAARRQIFDPTGALLGVTAVALCVGGMAWIAKLVPRRGHLREGPSWVAELVSAALAGGAGVADAFTAVARHPPDDVAGSLARCVRRVELGLSWAEALRRSHDESLARLGTLLERAESSGAPLAAALTAWARDERERVEREFERAVRRAPVLMVVPLVLCVLPAFVLVVVVPLLRALGQ